MPDDAASTPDKLLDAAARLFAERGIDNVSIAEIVRAAGQRNASAVHYHFGNRDAVLHALLARHIPNIASRRRELMERAKARPAGDVYSAAEAIVRPVTEFAERGWRERAYLQYGSELTDRFDRLPDDIEELFEQTVGFEAWTLMERRCPQVPSDIWRERRAILMAFVGRASADRARRLDAGDGDDGLSHEAFVANLIAMLVGAMTAPVP